MKNKAFTLIELLIVIAILGTLAVVILLALNPVQQLARARDSGRISAVTQLGHAIEAYATSNNGTYVPEAGCADSTGRGYAQGWITCLTNSGEISALPSQVAYAITTIPACTTNARSLICYNASSAAGAAPAIVYARMESASNNNKCTTAGQVAYAVYSTADGRGGIVCSATEPGPGSQASRFVN